MESGLKRKFSSPSCLYLSDRELRSVAVHAPFLVVLQPVHIPKTVSVMPYEVLPVAHAMFVFLVPLSNELCKEIKTPKALIESDWAEGN